MFLKDKSTYISMVISKRKNRIMSGPDIIGRHFSGIIELNAKAKDKGTKQLV